MKRAFLLIVIVAVLIAGGYISMAISRQGAQAIPGLLVQTNNPEASVSAVTPQKGAIFFAFTAVALGSVVGMGATIAVIFWLLSRGVTKVKQERTQGFVFTLNPATPNSVGAILMRRPLLTAIVALIMLAILVVVVIVTNNVLGFSIMAVTVALMLAPVVIIGGAILLNRS